jgi:hypothetical protein
MADFIAVNSEANFVRLDINANPAGYANANVAFAATADTMTVPALQEVTVNATPGTFNWSQLDELSEKVVTTPSTNSISVTLVLDPVTFFAGKGNTDGIFDIVNSKTETFFRLYWAGDSSTDRWIQGKGYLSALAPTVSPGAPVWTSPLEILVTGSYETGAVT